MAEKVTKCIKDWKVTVTLCYRNRLNRFMLLPPRVGKVLRANSQALALAREVKALGAAQRRGTRTQWQKKRGKKKTCLTSSLAYFLMQACKVIRIHQWTDTWQSAASDGVMLHVKKMKFGFLNTPKIADFTSIGANWEVLCDHWL